MLKRLVSNKELTRIILYCVFGGISAFAEFSVFAACIYLFALDKIIANIISIHISMLISFSLNTFLNFKKKDKLLRRFLLFYSFILLGVGLSSIIINFGTAYLNVLLVKFIAMNIVAVFHYTLNRFITYII